MLLRRGALLFFEIICQISRSRSPKNHSFFTQIGHFRTVTPVWIHGWLWNDAQSLKQHRRGALLFFKVILSNFKVTRDKKSLILTRIECFGTLPQVWIHWWLWNDAQSLKQHRRGALLFFKVIHQISRSNGIKNLRFCPELTISRLSLKLNIEEVPYCFSRSSIKFKGHTGKKNRRFFTQIEHFWTVTPVWIHPWLWNDAQSFT